MEATLTLIEKTAFLKGVDVLASIPTEALADLASRAREVHCEPDQVLYREGDPHQGVFLVIEGLLEQRRGRALVRVLKPGMAFGEFWLDEDEPYEYTVISIEHSHVLNVTREDMFDAMLDFPEFGVAMVRAMARRANELVGHVLELENLIGRLHAALKEAGIEPPDPRLPEADPLERGPRAPGAPEAGKPAAHPGSDRD